MFNRSQIKEVEIKLGIDTGSKDEVEPVDNTIWLTDGVCVVIMVVVLAMWFVLALGLAYVGEQIEVEYGEYREYMESKND